MPTVPAAEDMEDQIFLRHMDKRHRGDFKNYMELANLPGMTEYKMTLWRNFHRRCHEIATPGQHDHIHLEE